jgi:hypothetical protein
MIELTLNGVIREISPLQARSLVVLTEQPGWDLLLDMIEDMLTGTREALASAETPLEQIRQLQGRLSIVPDLLRLMRQFRSLGEQEEDKS